MNVSHSEPISFARRLVGMGTVLVGVLALCCCLSFLGSLWNTPQRTLSLVVTVSSALLIYFGVVIGLPDYLPAKIVALSVFAFGTLTTLLGLSILAWVAYNVFVSRQDGFRMRAFGQLQMPVLMVAVGSAMAAKSFLQLRNRGVPKT